MKWVKDKTGRFVQRPHYLPEELDVECELSISDFLRQRHSKITYPISTDDLTVLIEGMVDDLDLYADLSSEEGEVEGVTDFFVGHRPNVRISRLLTENPRMANRFRTTLTHELGHVKFHAFMFEAAGSTASLFPTSGPSLSNKCKRDSIIHAGSSNWMEWQAGYACGAFLMPTSALQTGIRTFIEDRKITVARFASSSREAEDLITLISNTFQVSRDAARVRLEQRGTVSGGMAVAGLFG